MGRPKLWAESLLLKMPEGMKARIGAALAEGEDTVSFIRAAIEGEIARRKRASARRS